MLESDEELATVVMENPRIGFVEGFIAVREQGDPITRPVLLLGINEIKKIQYALEDIANFNRDCSTDENATLLKEAMATILGDVLQINARQVTAEQAKKWFGLLSDSKRTALGTKELVKTLCSDRALWNSFLDRLDVALTNIQEIISQDDPNHKKRLYQDLNNYPYFWVYPEELLPPVQ